MLALLASQTLPVKGDLPPTLFCRTTSNARRFQGSGYQKLTTAFLRSLGIHHFRILSLLLYSYQSIST